MKNSPEGWKNIFDTGFPNEDFSFGYLTGRLKVSSDVSQLGVGKAYKGRFVTNLYSTEYFSKSSTPILVLHVGDIFQRFKFTAKMADKPMNSGSRLETYVNLDAYHAENLWRHHYCLWGEHRVN